MGRFILRFRGQGAASRRDIERIRSVRGLTVIDEASPRMLLVEAAEEELRKTLDVLPSWRMSAEGQVPLPDTRVKVKRPPEEEKRPPR